MKNKEMYIERMREVADEEEEGAKAGKDDYRMGFAFGLRYAAQLLEKEVFAYSVKMKHKF